MGASNDQSRGGVVSRILDLGSTERSAWLMRQSGEAGSTYKPSGRSTTLSKKALTEQCVNKKDMEMSGRIKKREWF
ncbi:hypothetical protein JCM18750_26780 [Halostagnicola bangensis]